jgi:hypothetical protein
MNFDGWIVAVAMAIPGHLHDVTSAHNLPLFRSIVNNLYALSDPGYDSCDYIVAGMKRKRVCNANE